MEAPTRARRRRSKAPVEAPPRSVDYRHLTSSLPLAEGYTDDQIAEIHVTALTVLQELGVRVNHAGARDILACAGAVVTDTQVRFGREVVEAAIASSPPEFTLTSGCGTLHIGGRCTQFLPAGGPPYAMDTVRGKRPGTLEDFQNFIRLSQAFDVIHMTAPSVEPQDIPANVRHLRMMRAQMLDSDKATFIYSRGAGQVADAFEILRLRYGLDEAAFQARPHTYTVINTNSPLILDIPMCQGLIDFAVAGQVCIITPFTLSGAMAPVTIPGALVQQHAEMLAGLVLTQTVRPGAPVVYGGFTSNVDMKSGAPAFGTPEYVKGTIASGQLARRYGLPYRSSNVNAANSVDAQAAYESQMSVWATIMGGANLVWHGAGWMEGGLTSSFEKVIIDADNLQMMAEVMKPIQVDESTLGLEAIEDVGIGGHFFGTAHTIERYENAFYEPMVSDWRNFESWEEAGSPSAAQHANRIWKKLLREYEPPPMAADRREELDEFVKRRKLEIGEQKW